MQVRSEFGSNLAFTPTEPYRRVLDVFISHSAKDASIAEALIQLLRAALSIHPEKIRCTSVDGYRLPVGASTEERLKHEVHEARSFIGLITRDSLQSAYVLFELGARWGAGRPLAPLLAAGAAPNALGGPLSGFNALSCDSREQLFQLVADIGHELGVPPALPFSYQKHVDDLLEVSTARIRTDAPLVALFDPLMTGELIDKSTNEHRAFMLMPVTVINEDTRTITPEYFQLAVGQATSTVRFVQTQIPAGVTWGSQTQNISIPHAADHDFTGRTQSLLPGEATTGFLMFSTPDMSLDALRRLQESDQLLQNMTMSCVDIRGAMHAVLLQRLPPNVPGPVAKLGVSVVPR